MSAWARIGSRRTDLSDPTHEARCIIGRIGRVGQRRSAVHPSLGGTAGERAGRRSGGGRAGERAGGGWRESWWGGTEEGWASDLSDSSDLSDRAQPHPMTPGLRRYALYIRPRQGVALTDRQSVRHPGGVAGLLATTGPRVIGAAPLRPVARKRAPSRGVFFIAIKDLCKMVFGRKSTAFSAGTLQNAPDARN